MKTEPPFQTAIRKKPLHFFLRQLLLNHGLVTHFDRFTASKIRTQNLKFATQNSKSASVRRNTGRFLSKIYT